MRRLMWFSIGFAAACIAGVYWVNGPWLLLLAIFTLVAAAALFFVKTEFAKRAFAVLLGCAIGLIWLFGYDWLYLADARALDDKEIELRIEVSEYGYMTGNSMRSDGFVKLDERQYKVVFYLHQSDAIAPGDVVEGTFRLRYTADGGAHAPTYHQGKGIYLMAYSTDMATVTPAESISKRHFAVILRQNIQDVLDMVFQEDVQGFARALLLGDDSLLTYEEDSAFQASGIRHVIAVSGLHVSILFSLVYMLSGKRRYLTALFGIPVLFLFAAVVGFTPSIVRACIMQGLMILALLFNKEYDPPTALAFSVLVMLVVNPLTVTSVSFQLSVGCMIGIFLFSGRISGYLLDEKRLGPAKGKGIKARLTRWIVGSVSVTLSSLITTTPLCAYYFGMISLVGVLNNLLALWVISFIFYGIMVACVVGAIWLPAGTLIGSLIAWPIRYVLWMAKTLGSFPLAAVYTDSAYVVLGLVFCYLLLVVFLKVKDRHPVLLGSCMAICLCIALGFSWLEPRMDDYRITVLDVGQGQSILLQTQKKTYLVDCGGDSDTETADLVARKLLSQGIFRLDGVILTHYDKDHGGGMQALLSRIPTDTLYLPDVSDGSGIRQTLTDLYDRYICWVTDDAQLKIADFLTIFPAEEGKTDNESSLCVLFQPENCDILITGDRTVAGERALLADYSIPDLEVLIVGHHGARTSTSLELLQQTDPEVAVISVGTDNRYGHPTAEVLERLELFGCTILRTDQDGTIILRG